MPKTKLVSWVVYHVHVKIKADTKERIEEVAKKTRRDIGFDISRPRHLLGGGR